MNLRKKIAREIVEAIIHDLNNHGWRYSDGEHWQIWTELAESKLVSHSLEFPEGGYSSEHPDVVEAFLTKYPKLRGVAADCERAALAIDPEAVVELAVAEDHDACHVCYEGQYLRAYVQFHAYKDDAFMAMRARLEEWWATYPGAYGPDMDEEVRLFLPTCPWPEEIDG